MISFFHSKENNSFKLQGELDLEKNLKLIYTVLCSLFYPHKHSANPHSCVFSSTWQFHLVEVAHLMKGLRGAFILSPPLSPAPKVSLH